MEHRKAIRNGNEKKSLADTGFKNHATQALSMFLYKHKATAFIIKFKFFIHGARYRSPWCNIYNRRGTTKLVCLSTVIIILVNGKTQVGTIRCKFA